MANRNNVNTPPPSEDNDDIDNIPDEMDDSAKRPSMSSAQSNGNSDSDSGMSLDELFEKEMNYERDERNRAAMDPPAGDWIKEGPFELKKRVFAGDCAPDDIDPVGRTFLTFEGEVKSRTVGEHTYTPKLFLRVSPDVRFKESDPSQIDHWHTMWLRAADTYLAVKSERPTIRKLIMFLMTDEYMITTRKGDSGPFVVGTKKVYEKKQAYRR